MPFSSGTFSLYTPGNPVVTGTTIASTWAQNTLNDIATGLSTCVLKDGTQTITQNIPMSSFKFTGLGVGSATTDSANIAQVQNGFGSFLTSVAGTNTITATATPTPTYTVGQRFTFLPAVTNTGATTLNISSVGAGAVQMAGAALVGGELVANIPVTVYVSAATPVFQIIGSPASKGTFTASLTGCTTVPTVTASYSVTNGVVTVFYPGVTGTSNTTACTLTGAPAAIQPASAHAGFYGIVQDNGSIVAVGRIDVETTGVVTLYTASNGAGFTGSGTKGPSVGLTLTYNL